MDRRVLLTGVTGSLGRYVFYELFTKTDYTIYLIIRPKFNMNGITRFNKMLDESIPMIRCLDRDMINNRTKVLDGDIGVANFGIADPEIIETLRGTITDVINCASDVSFKTTVLTGINNIILPIYYLAQWVETLEVLESFVDVSTAYVGANLPSNSIVDEDPVKINIDMSELINLLNLGDTHSVQMKYGKYLENWPNVYTGCKSLAEAVLIEMSKKYPPVIIRPSIISVVLLGEDAGYVDVSNAVIPVTTKIYEGKYTLFPCDGNIILDVVPVDYVARSIILLGKYYRYHRTSNSVPFGYPKIFHITTSTTNPVTLQNFTNYFTRPVNRNVHFPENLRAFQTQLIDEHLNKPDPVVRHNGLLWQLYLPFFINTWYFTNRKFRKFYHKIATEDRKLLEPFFNGWDWSIYQGNVARFYLTNIPQQP